jgi:hypothetical protein
MTSPNEVFLAPLIEHFRIASISFFRNINAELLLPEFSMDERPIGSPLAEGEEIFADIENAILVSVPTGEHYVNPSVYHRHHIVLAGDSSADALAAAQTFFNASWLQCLDETRFLEDLLVDDVVNLREEGHAQREGDYIFLWAVMSYFEEGPQAKILFSEFVAAVHINLQYIKQKKAFLEQLALHNIRHVAELPADDELPHYRGA